MKIISDGQTGVDRAALDAALELGIPCGGWCPRGRGAEDGVIPPKYLLKETPTADAAERAERNVQDSDATLVLTIGRVNDGATPTLQCVHKHQRPCLVVDMAHPVNLVTVSRWIEQTKIKTLNVAGPKESSQPGIYRLSLQLLEDVLAECGNSPAVTGPHHPRD